MAKFTVTVYRSGYVRTEQTIEVEADTEEAARDAALSYGSEHNMSVIRDDRNLDDVDVEEQNHG